MAKDLGHPWGVRSLGKNCIFKIFLNFILFCSIVYSWEFVQKLHVWPPRSPFQIFIRPMVPSLTWISVWHMAPSGLLMIQEFLAPGDGGRLGNLLLPPALIPDTNRSSVALKFSLGNQSFSVLLAEFEWGLLTQARVTINRHKIG